ncbi:phage major capsid protein [Vibrio rotiferianus]|uniref:phage major capsid protein n=1 Tax=Vibrio rotiferianus TaxID=190895 RepID=UPI00339157E4
MTILKKALASADAQTQEQISRVYIEKAIDNDVLLSLINREAAISPEFYKTVLKVFTGVQDGEENTGSTPPVLSTEPVYVRNQAYFKKVESLLPVSHEIIADSTINIREHVYGQIMTSQAVKYQNDLINSLEFGMANGAIDRPNGFVESLKDDATRRDDVYQIIKSGVAGEFGADTPSKVQFLKDLIQAVPSRYQPNVRIFMNRNTWFTEYAYLEDTSGNTINYSIEPLKWMGYQIVLLDGLPDDTIIVGDIKAAIALVEYAASFKDIEDELTKKGLSEFYVSERFSGICLDNTAIRVGIAAV